MRLKKRVGVWGTGSSCTFPQTATLSEACFVIADVVAKAEKGRLWKHYAAKYRIFSTAAPFAFTQHRILYGVGFGL